MKTENVSQDDANFFEGKSSSIQYAVDENGNYTQVKSLGLEPSNIVLQQAWDDIKEESEHALEDVRKGLKSPIYYFMIKEIMDVKILSETTGLSRWRIKRHFKPRIFNKLSDKLLLKYIDAFKLKNVEDLKAISNK